MQGLARGRFASDGRRLQMPLIGDCGFLNRRESLPL